MQDIPTILDLTEGLRPVGGGSPVSASSVSRVVGFWSNILIYVGRATRPGKVEDRRLLLKETTDFL